MNQEILSPVRKELDPPNELSRIHDESFEKQNKDEENDIPLPNFAFNDGEKNDQVPSKNITSHVAGFDVPSKNHENLAIKNEPLQKEGEESETSGKVLSNVVDVENSKDEVLEVAEEVTDKNDLPCYRVAAASFVNAFQNPHDKQQGTTDGVIDSATLQINVIENSRSNADVPNSLPPNNAMHIMSSMQKNRRQTSMNGSSPRRIHTNQRRRQQNGSNSIEHRLEEVDLEGWVDADVEEESEAVGEFVINRRLENMYKKKLTLLSIGAIVFVLLYLLSLDLFAFEVITLVFAVFYAIGAFFVASKLSKADFVKVKRRWKAVVLLEWIFLCQFAVFITLKLHGDLSYKLVFHTIPGFISILLFFGIAEPPPSVKNVMIISRALLWTQLLLISLKLDDSVGYNWNVAFVLVWLVLISLLIGLGASIMVFIYLLLRSKRGEQLPSNMPINFQLLNTGMNVALLAIAIICTVIISTYTDYLEESNETKGTLQGATLAGAIYTVILAILMIAFKKPVKKFLRNDWVANQEMMRRTQKKRRVVSFKSENVKQSEYFVQMSPTYFLIFEEAIYLPGKESIQRMKQYMMNVRYRGKKQQEVEQQQKTTSKITLETLKSMGGKTERTREHLSTKLNASMESPSPLKTGDLQIDFNTEDKLALSFDDKEAIEDFVNMRKAAYNPDKGQDDGESLCIICYQKNADSVFMNCGHGGVCFDCAQETWRKRSKCITCREVIREILRVTPMKGTNDFVKSLSITTKTYEFNNS